MPPPPTVVDWLVKAGPYAVTVLVLLWLYLERNERVKAQADVNLLLKKQVDERGESVKAMAEFGEATRDRLREHDQQINNVLELLRRDRR